MNKDLHIEINQEAFEAEKDRQIAEWVNNGCHEHDAQQLWDDIQRDPYHADDDAPFLDTTIDERLDKYSN